MANVKVVGILNSNVITAMLAELNNVKNRTMKGLIRAQARIYESMNTVSPKIPVDEGNMRSSYFCVTSNKTIIHGKAPHFKDREHNQARLTTDHVDSILTNINKLVRGEKGPSIAIGFSAWYTWYVHEMVGAHFTRKGSGAKFFEAALKRNIRYCLRIIAREARIKK